MAQIQVPEAVSGRILGFGPELWAPGQIVLRMRSGVLSEPLLRADARWRGVVQIGTRSSWRAASVAAVSAIELFLAQMSRPGAWCEMPWGGDPPFYRTPAAAVAGVVTVAAVGGSGFSIQLIAAASRSPLVVGQVLCGGGRCGRVTAAGAVDAMGVQAGVRTDPALPVVAGESIVETYYGTVHQLETAASGFQLIRRSGGGTGPLEVGQWVCARGRCAIVKEAQREFAGIQMGIRTVPTLPLLMGTGVGPAAEMRMRFPSSGDDTINLPRGGSFAGPWSMPWEEYLG